MKNVLSKILKILYVAVFVVVFHIGICEAYSSNLVSKLLQDGWPPRSAVTILNVNVPTFTKWEKTLNKGFWYSSLDALGRCGPAIGVIEVSSMPIEKRGYIGMVKPSGWHLKKYSGVEHGYLYNRCHLIGWQLSGENENPKNLITGTRYMNTKGMLPFENRLASFVKKTGRKVLYKVTPVFVGRELLSRGVVMEAMSIDDGGRSIHFHVFVANIQPGIIIDYATGDSRERHIG